MVKQLAIAIDQAFNCLVHIDGDGWGFADETLSARLWRCWLQGRCGPLPWQLVDALFFWQDRHCYRAWRSEIERAQLPGHYRSAVTEPATSSPPRHALARTPSSIHPPTGGHHAH